LFAQAITKLLNHNEPVGSMEQLMQGEQYFLRDDHSLVSPMSDILEEINSLADEPTSKKSRTRQPSYLSPQQNEKSSIANMKVVSQLIIRSHEVFPFLLKVDVEPSVWKTYIQDLTAAGQRFLVMRYIDLLKIDEYSN
jgi:hypothetical protein